MRIILFLLRKEFLQVFRNKSMLPLIFMVPIIQLIILVNAATFEMKSIRIFIIDNDMSSSSRSLISKISGSPFYKIVNTGFSYKQAMDEMHKGKTDAILNIPPDFEKKLFKENTGKIQLVINAINGTSAGLISAYTNTIINDFNRKIIIDASQNIAVNASLIKSLNINYSFWYNPELNYKTFMVPGVLVLLVTLIGFVLSSMNVVREKEIGTIEQINVTPIKKYQFIIGKLFPIWIIGLFELAFGLAIGKLLFNIPMVGSLPLLFFVASLYLIVVLGMGMFVSTLVETQQQAMLISFFLLMIFILMSGLFTSIESMPDWAQYIVKANPIAYFIKIIRLILLKGAGIMEIKKDIIILVLFGISMMSFAIIRYRKTS
ncbi:MAG: ABC transporter permease [Bacteroidetes bacterium GWE2_29_8]|nr:MAG: ABC transporter permease [Bacteroidetes bacterium GWE2_29_8]OFY22383.1 MAG: ABC transporter permease [Bacteroidetes bacterium GWF2_29_10]